jgi:hypothetical protein
MPNEEDKEEGEGGDSGNEGEEGEEGAGKKKRAKKAFQGSLPLSHSVTLSLSRGDNAGPEGRPRLVKKPGSPRPSRPPARRSESAWQQLPGGAMVPYQSAAGKRS